MRRRRKGNERDDLAADVLRLEREEMRQMRERYEMLDDILRIGAPAAIGLRLVRDALREIQEVSARAVQESQTIIRTQTVLGGVAGDVARTAAEFRSIGLDSAKMAEVMERFRERLFQDPLAIGAFGRSVIPERLGGRESSAAVFREAITLLERATTAEERRNRAIRLGLQEFLPLFETGPETRRRLLEGAEATSELLDPELRRQRADSEARRIRREMAEERRALELEKGRRIILDPIEEAWTRYVEWRAGGVRGRGAARGESTADAQTQATRENTEALRILKEEFANAGRQAAGAVPGGLRGDALQKALETKALQLGAFRAL